MRRGGAARRRLLQRSGLGQSLGLGAGEQGVQEPEAWQRTGLDAQLVHFFFEPALSLVVLLLDAGLLRKKLFHHFALLKLKRETCGLLFQFGSLGLGCLLQPHQLLVVLLAKH